MKIEVFSSQGKLKMSIMSTLRALLKLLNKMNLSGSYHFLLIGVSRLAIGLIASKFDMYTQTHAYTVYCLPLSKLFYTFARI